MDNQEIVLQDQEVSTLNEKCCNEGECCNDGECDNQEKQTNHPEIGKMLSNLDDLFKGNDDLLNNFKKL